MKLENVSDEQLASIYASCQKSVYSTCDGCYMFGHRPCKSKVRDEMAKRFYRYVKDKAVEQ